MMSQPSELEARKSKGPLVARLAKTDLAESSPKERADPAKVTPPASLGVSPSKKKVAGVDWSKVVLVASHRSYSCPASLQSNPSVPSTIKTKLPQNFDPEKSRQNTKSKASPPTDPTTNTIASEQAKGAHPAAKLRPNQMISLKPFGDKPRPNDPVEDQRVRKQGTLHIVTRSKPQVIHVGLPQTPPDVSSDSEGPDEVEVEVTCRDTPAKDNSSCSPNRPPEPSEPSAISGSASDQPCPNARARAIHCAVEGCECHRPSRPRPSPRLAKQGNDTGFQVLKESEPNIVRFSFQFPAGPQSATSQRQPVDAPEPTSQKVTGDFATTQKSPVTSSTCRNGYEECNCLCSSQTNSVSRSEEGCNQPESRTPRGQEPDPIQLSFLFSGDSQVPTQDKPSSEDDSDEVPSLASSSPSRSKLHSLPHVRPRPVLSGKPEEDSLPDKSEVSWESLHLKKGDFTGLQKLQNPSLEYAGYLALHDTPSGPVNPRDRLWYFKALFSESRPLDEISCHKPDLTLQELDLLAALRDLDSPEQEQIAKMITQNLNENGRIRPPDTTWEWEYYYGQVLKNMTDQRWYYSSLGARYDPVDLDYRHRRDSYFAHLNAKSTLDKQCHELLSHTNVLIEGVDFSAMAVSDLLQAQREDKRDPWPPAQRADQQAALEQVAKEMTRRLGIARTILEPEGTPTISNKWVRAVALAAEAAPRAGLTEGGFSIFKQTTRTQAITLRALGGLCLMYADQDRQPDWRLLAQLWVDAHDKGPGCSTTFTSFAQAIADAVAYERTAREQVQAFAQLNKSLAGDLRAKSLPAEDDFMYCLSVILQEMGLMDSWSLDPEDEKLVSTSETFRLLSDCMFEAHLALDDLITQRKAKNRLSEDDEVYCGTRQVPTNEGPMAKGLLRRSQDVVKEKFKTLASRLHQIKREGVKVQLA